LNLVETKIQQVKSNRAASTISYSIVDHSVASGVGINLLLLTLWRLLSSSNQQVLSYTCWALSHLSDGMSSSITAVVTSGDLRDVRS